MATPATDLHHRIEGRPDGPVLVLSHAMGASMAMWEPQVDGLSRAFRVLRYDHRGHGASPVPAGPYTIADIGGGLPRRADPPWGGRPSIFWPSPCRGAARRP